MSSSLKDALLKSGLVRPEDTDEARRARDQRERQRKQAAAVDEKASDTAPRPDWEAAPTGHIVDSRDEKPR